MSLFKQETQAIETHWFPRNSLHYYQRSRWAAGIQFTLTCRSRLSEWVSDFDFVSTGAISAERCCLNYQTWCRANICGYRNQSILDQLATDRKKKKSSNWAAAPLPKEITGEKAWGSECVLTDEWWSLEELCLTAEIISSYASPNFIH